MGTKNKELASHILKRERNKIIKKETSLTFSSNMKRSERGTYIKPARLEKWLSQNAQSIRKSTNQKII